MTWTLHLTTTPESPQSELLSSALIDFNAHKIGDYTPEDLLLTATSLSGDFIGGIGGCIQFGWLYIDKIWVAESQRRKGLGTALLNELETIAYNRGIKRSWLRTASFQEARTFYEHLGYQIFAERPLALKKESGDTHMDYFMQKNLSKETEILNPPNP